MKRCAMALALALAGCASTSPRASQQAVDELVAQRGLPAAHPVEDAEVQQRVQTLLAKPLSEATAMELALLRNPGLQATFAQLGIAQADLVQAGLLRNPSLGAAVGFPLNGGVLSVQGSLAEDVLAVFTLPLKKRFAERALEEARLRVGAAVVELDVRVQQAFVTLQAAQQQVELLRAINDAESAASELAQRQRQAGNISELEALSRIAAGQQAQLDLMRAEAELLEARESLTRLLGLWGSETAFTVREPLPAVPAEEPPLEHLEALAMRGRLDLAAARAQAEGLERALALAGDTRFIGGLGLGAQAERSIEGHTSIGPVATLELPLFDQGQARLARLDAELSQARAHQQELALQIRSEVRLARARVLTSRAMVEQHRKVLLPLRARIVALSQQRYDAMLLGVYGLLQARQSEVFAQRGYLDALRDYWLARAELVRALGTRPTPNSLTRTP